jgi:hypothetical protein
MFSEFDKIFDLVSSTGDKVIIHNAGKNYVLMPFEKYEKVIKQPLEAENSITELSEDELLERINNEIARWRENQLESENLPYFTEKNERLEELRDQQAEVEDHYYLEPID